MPAEDVVKRADWDDSTTERERLTVVASLASVGRWNKPRMLTPAQALELETLSKLTIRLPGETAERLRSLARARGLSVNKLMEELSTQAIASFDAANRFRAMARHGDFDEARRILDRPDSA